MGSQQTKVIKTGEERQGFMKRILNDLKALEMMLERGMIETGVKRIGAEQELNLVGHNFRPAMVGLNIFNKMQADFLTLEYAKFNLEINSDPIDFSDDCLVKLKNELKKKIRMVDKTAIGYDATVALAGILPTITKNDITPDALTPVPRFKALFDVVQKARGRNYEFHIEGVDELITRDNPTVFGGCMTSFQIHLQAEPDNIRDLYNWSQATAGPLLSCTANSSLFMNKRLWRETRIALFQQTSDTRRPYENYIEEDARVSFGNGWVENSILEVFQDDVAKYHAYLSTDSDEDSVAMVEQGLVPKLEALSFHNGTVYKWNRPCYGVIDGKPHLRIENRIFPAGPTLEDEIANTALWLGVMNAMPEEYRNIHKKMDFADAKDNFIKAARLGLEVQFHWFTKKAVPAQELLLKEFIPLAKEGLANQNLSKENINHYLGIIEERVKSGRTGAKWMLDSFNKLTKDYSRNEAVMAITNSMIKKQKRDLPVHKWALPDERMVRRMFSRFETVEQVMTTNLYTVQDDDVVNLAAHIMNWKKIGHVPVEDEQRNLVGLITKDTLINFLVNNMDGDLGTLPVQELMLTDLITVPPETKIADAIELMMNNNLTSLPIVKDKNLIGIVTEHDFVAVSKNLLREIDELKRGPGNKKHKDD